MMYGTNNGRDHSWFGISGSLAFGGPGSISIDSAPVLIERRGEAFVKQDPALARRHRRCRC